jgi:sodium-dependent dicarboxylate transporter 2/3/5
LEPGATLVWLYPVSGIVDPNVKLVVHAELEKLGPMTTAELRVAIVFGITALAWVMRPLYSALVPAVGDTTIAIGGARALFLLPSGMPQRGRLLAWDDLKSLP